MTKSDSASRPHAPWWQTAVIYQVYPRSFQDSDGDGVGDLAGIVQRLDYLVSLGVDAVWISPFYPSPMRDFGYDVAEYCDVDPLFGTLADFDVLIAAVHARGLKMILDFVPNHTSDEHPWFVDSRSSRAAARRDWYIWRDPAPDGGPPNNWLSHFGGSSWEWDAASGQYYLHSFLKEQPDLDWRNPAVRDAMFDVLRFWLDRGVDGFRVDVLWLLIKDKAFRDNPPNLAYVPGNNPRDRLLSLYDADQPETLAIVADMRRLLAAYDGDRLLIGEIYLPVDRLVAYYGDDLGGAQMPFNFQLVGAPWTAETLAGIIRRYEAALPPGAWPNWVLGNHDQSRIATRIGAAQARVAAVLLLTLRGTPTLYYGDEIGMADVPIAPEQVRDPAERNQPGLGLGRDPERTPMQWSSGPQAGFSTTAPWLPLAADHRVVNVETADADPASLLSLYRALIALSRNLPALTLGTIDDVTAEETVLRYERRQGSERIVIALNLGAHAQIVTLPSGRLVLSTSIDRDLDALEGPTALRANEAVVLLATS